MCRPLVYSKKWKALSKRLLVARGRTALPLVRVLFRLSAVCFGKPCFHSWPQTQRQPPGVQRETEESCTLAKPFGEEAPRVFSYRSSIPCCSSSNLSFPLVFSRRCEVGWLEWLHLPGTSALNDLPKGGALGTLSPPRGCSTATLQAPHRRQPARALVVLLEKNRRASCFEEVESLLLMIGLSL